MNTAGRGLGAVKYTRSQRKRLSRDRQRYIRVVESFDFSGIYKTASVKDNFFDSSLDCSLSNNCS